MQANGSLYCGRIDKFDRLGREGVEALLGQGRNDESGDFTAGAGFQPNQIDYDLQPFRLAEAARATAGV